MTIDYEDCAQGKITFVDVPAFGGSVNNADIQRHVPPQLNNKAGLGPNDANGTTTFVRAFCRR